LKNPTSVFKDTVMPAAAVEGAQFNALVDFVSQIRPGKFVPGKTPMVAGTGATPGGTHVIMQADPTMARRIDALSAQVRGLREEISRLKSGLAPPLPELPPIPEETQAKAIAVFNAKCKRCHMIEGIKGVSGGGLLGPKFAKGRSPRTKDELIKIIEDPPAGLKKETIMPQTKLTDPTELDALAEFLLRLSPKRNED
jgi:mono/diheme cytochrome c family protein